jgi:hypothetical protein
MERVVGPDTLHPTPAAVSQQHSTATTNVMQQQQYQPHTTHVNVLKGTFSRKS